jgi:WD40 repeat protein
MAKYKLKIDLGDLKAGHIVDSEDRVFPVFTHIDSNGVVYSALLTNTKVCEKVEEKTYINATSSADGNIRCINRASDNKFFNIDQLVYAKDEEDEYVFYIEKITLQDNTAILSGGNVAFNITEVEYLATHNFNGSWVKY